MEYINHKDFHLQDSIVLLGNFDGLHLGHQQLIEAAKTSAIQKMRPIVAFSFYPHPRTVLSSQQIPTILTRNEKKQMLELFGINYFIEYPFDVAFSQISPQQFFSDIIVQRLGCSVLVVGEGYRFGKKQEGNVSTLYGLCKEAGIQLIVVPHFHIGAVKISSSTIRQAVLHCDFELVEEELGRQYSISGIVENGKKIGRTIGFPTVNIIPEPQKWLPPKGIYVTKTVFLDAIRESVTNIGHNPTVGGNNITVETYIFDFDQELYGQDVTVYFYKKIRDEIKFADVEALRVQIQSDVEIARQYWRTYHEK